MSRSRALRKLLSRSYASAIPHFLGILTTIPMMSPSTRTITSPAYTIVGIDWIVCETVVVAVLTAVLMALLIEVPVSVVVVATPGGAEAAAKLTSCTPVLGGDALSVEVTATA
jgi:hypothetical protein